MPSACRSYTRPEFWGASYGGLLGPDLEWQMPSCLPGLAFAA